MSILQPQTTLGLQCTAGLHLGPQVAAIQSPSEEFAMLQTILAQQFCEIFQHDLPTHVQPFPAAPSVHQIA